MHRASGFTILELMIVVAIIGILATLAIPSYQAYISRAKFIEVVHATAPYKLAVAMCAHEHGTLDVCGTPGKNGIPNTFYASDAHTGYVASVGVTDKGKVTASSQRIIIGNHTSYTYVLMPMLHPNGLMTWKIDSSSTCLEHGLCKE